MASANRIAKPINAGIVGGMGALVALLAFATQGESQSVKPAPSNTKTASKTNANNLAFFESKVRPLLLDSCVSCHGKANPQGGLRLDAPLPADKAEEVLKRVKGEGGKPRMPLGVPLPNAKIAILEEWVRTGAKWPAAHNTTMAAPTLMERGKTHWAFQPVRQPNVPTPPATMSAWARNPIDSFVLKKLTAAGLKPAPAASRRELIRRLSYDLTGLPPTPEEVMAFENDRDPNAYNKLVDRLLASPHYGEKWGRFWLDLVRYAETNSYERDNPKPNITRYRDYVIRAFNNDKPYDRFIKEQLAGDEMNDPTGDALIATGYYRLGIWDDEPADVKQAEYDDLDDLVATTSQAFLGLTMDCARCHDHKLDPLTQKDYYSLLSFFHNINRFRNGGPTDEMAFFASDTQRQEFTRKTAELEVARKAKQGQIETLEHWYREHRSTIEAPADLANLRYRYYEGNWKSLPDFDALTPKATGNLTLLDLKPHQRQNYFAFVFEGELNVAKEGDYTFHMDSDDGARLTVGGKKLIESGAGGMGHEKSAKIHLAAGKTPFRIDYQQAIGPFGLSVAWSGPGFARHALSTFESCNAMGLPTLTAAEITHVLDKDRLAQYNQFKKEKEELDKQEPPVDKALCVTETGPNAPETFILQRGNPTTPGEKVGPAFPTCLNGGTLTLPTPKPDAKTTGRRTLLADWIASPNNPLTARVIVNRIWQGHFGRGLVRTPNDFGLQGAPPTHPELLEWLAAQFAGTGTGREKLTPWSFKSLHRLILTSNAYKQSSRSPQQELALSKDPQNDLLWRFDMRRLTAEEIRDSLLAVSGTLNLTLYGDCVYPEIPKEILAGQSRPGNDWYTEKMKPEDLNRRSIYIHVKRSLIYPLLASFDLPEPDRTSPVRFASTQPTQALSMMNGPLVNQQATLLAARVRKELTSQATGNALSVGTTGTTDVGTKNIGTNTIGTNTIGTKSIDPTAFVRRIFSLTMQRTPSASEVAVGVQLMSRLQARGAKPEKAQDYLALMALNLDEFIYIE